MKKDISNSSSSSSSSSSYSSSSISSSSSSSLSSSSSSSNSSSSSTFIKSSSSSSGSSSSSTLADAEINANRYRFSGYQPPLIQLDETGPAYWVADVHPYYKNQPESWQKPVSQGSYFNTVPRSGQIEEAIQRESGQIPPNTNTLDGDLYDMLPLS